MQIYQTFVIELIKNNYNMQLHPGTNSDRFAAYPIYWTFIYDERFGKNNWNEFKIVQFDWLYNDLGLSMGAIKCWMQLNIKNMNQIDSRDKLFDICSKSFFDNKKYFDHVNNILQSQSNVKHAHSNYDEDEVTQQDRQHFDDIYYPCNKALYSLLKVRKHDILIGQWLQWKINITL